MSMLSLQTNSARSSWRRDERNFIGISWTTNTSKLRNGGSNDCRKFWMSLMCGSQDLTLQAILSNGVATVRQTLRRMFSAMAAERAKTRRQACVNACLRQLTNHAEETTFTRPSLLYLHSAKNDYHNNIRP